MSYKGSFHKTKEGLLVPGNIPSDVITSPVRTSPAMLDHWECTYEFPDGGHCDYKSDRFDGKHLDEHYGSHHVGDRSY